MKFDLSRRERPLLLASLALLFGPATNIGCVASDLRSMKEAEAAYEECVSLKSESHPDCKAAWVTYLERQRRYEEISRTAWGCDPAAEECPTPR